MMAVSAQNGTVSEPLYQNQNKAGIPNILQQDQIEQVYTDAYAVEELDEIDEDEEEDDDDDAEIEEDDELDEEEQVARVANARDALPRSSGKPEHATVVAAVEHKYQYIDIEK